MSDVDRRKPDPPIRSGYHPIISESALLGTGGLTIGNSGTTSTLIPVGNIKVSLGALALEFLTAATSSAAVTVQVFKVDSGGNKTALCAATSIKSDVITGAGAANYALPITAAKFDSAQGDRVIDGTSGFYLQVDVVAAGTVSAQPQGTVTAQLYVLN
jgi:hypothetical protein